MVNLSPVNIVKAGKEINHKAQKKPRQRIGVDLSILDRTLTGTSVYAWNLFLALKGLAQDDFEFIPLRSPKPLPRKNLLTKFGNFFLEIFWLAILLPIKARRLNLDLVHMPANVISPVLSKPQVCSIHDVHFITNPEGRDPLWSMYARRAFRFSARNADKILCDSYSASEEVVKILGADPEKIEVIYLGLTRRISGAADKKEVARFKPYILSVGATDPNKNFKSLIEAYALLAEREPAFEHRLLIAGPPGSDHPALVKLVHEKDLEKRVELLGGVLDPMLAALYENASLFVYPSLCEGFGFPPLEAMHYGVPVLASHAPSIPEILGDAPLYFDPKNISEICEKILSLISDPELMKKHAVAGEKRAAQFSWEKTASDTIRVYHTLLNHRRVRS